MIDAALVSGETSCRSSVGSAEYACEDKGTGEPGEEARGVGLEGGNIAKSHSGDWVYGLVSICYVASGNYGSSCLY